MPRLPNRGIRRTLVLLLALALLVAGGIGAYLVYNGSVASNSGSYILRWFSDASSRPALSNARVACPGAPFILPSAGLIGLLYSDPTPPYNIASPHTGLDIFGDGAPGQVPVYSVYDGYLTRLPNWFSSVIIRHDDPLVPGRTIWTYYTHMGAADGSRSYVASSSPAGTTDLFIPQGTLLGMQGLYSPGRPIGLHVHFSIVTANADGSFRNEAQLANTLDPSPYFRLPLNNAQRPERPIRCTP